MLSIEQLESRDCPSAVFGTGYMAWANIPEHVKPVMLPNIVHATTLPYPPWSAFWTKLPGGEWLHSDLPGVTWPVKGGPHNG